MTRHLVRLLLMTVMVSGASMQAASTFDLFDWCIRSNGVEVGCNGGGALAGNVNGAGFDFNFSPNSLGQLVITLGPSAVAQNAFVYLDYDIDTALLGSNTEYVNVVGAVPSGVSYQTNDPSGAVSLWNSFSTDSLNNTNYVNAGTIQPPVCCEVVTALGIGGLNIGAGQTGTVTFTASTTAPSGFYLQQLDAAGGDSIYLSVSAVISGGGPPPTFIPEPGTITLFGAVGAALALRVLRRQRGQ